VTREKVYQYPGEEVDVSWNQSLCIHIAECGRSQGGLFEGGRQPWCQPDVTTADDVVDVIERCPSGALTYQLKDGSIVEAAADENTVVVTYYGPLFVRGDLDIEGTSEKKPGTRFRAALCRCGQSGNKPFCDNSHLEADFDDSGAVGQKSTITFDEATPLKIRPMPNGPLLLSGNVTIKASSGRVAWQGKQAALCRCGGSSNKPFCDGTHTNNGFQSE